MDGLSGEVEMLWSSSKKRWKSKSSMPGDCIIYPLDWVGYTSLGISRIMIKLEDWRSRSHDLLFAGFRFRIYSPKIC